ncbi:MAG TPA: (4Fe-4S)-binding protein [Candidatus Tidjanibacter gallistercoris]|nr:(4Fe-4S)-binding protein [Candidatus Tidjanibacter gallistercoris]
MEANHKHYDNGEITVHWKPELCWHAAECVSRLPAVFDVKKRPWVDVQGATTEEIIRVVELCPSGALSWSKTGDGR